ncbi:MAG TPA: hypothetical protein VF294_07925 [Polyangiaceae bacterium]
MPTRLDVSALWRQHRQNGFRPPSLAAELSPVVLQLETYFLKQ